MLGTDFSVKKYFTELQAIESEVRISQFTTRKPAASGEVGHWCEEDARLSAASQKMLRICDAFPPQIRCLRPDLRLMPTDYTATVQ